MEHLDRAHPSPPGRWRRALTLFALAGLAVAPLACGSDPEATDAALPELADSDSGTDSDDSGSGSEDGDESDSAEQPEPGEVALEFAQCMRDNGVPDFPDPEIDGDNIMQRGPDGGQDDPAMRTAQETCEPIMEQMAPTEVPSPEEQARMEEDMLASAQCVRDHGFPTFPDPEFDNGRVTMRMTAELGIDMDDPAFQQAQEDCRPEGMGPGDGGITGPGSGSEVDAGGSAGGGGDGS